PLAGSLRPFARWEPDRGWGRAGGFLRRLDSSHPLGAGESSQIGNPDETVDPVPHDRLDLQAGGLETADRDRGSGDELDLHPDPAIRDGRGGGRVGAALEQGEKARREAAADRV